MIPQRVKLKGFLCYKEEQTIDFEGTATLWMLSGLNGSGKSAIFDAVTYALFGHHRGGGQHAIELINKDSDTMVVEFDFLLDNKPYRAKRTLKRDTKGGARGTQQMLRLEAGTNGHAGGKWMPIEETGQRREFDSWVEENLGLTYDTFTSSVLLLQGKAEKLLDSKPEGRREVLASIVDLERYERLHQKVDDKRKAQESALKTLASRLEALRPVQPLEIVEAKGCIAEAETARSAARAEVERLQKIQYDAGRWQELQQRLSQARGRWQRAQDVLGDAAAIEQRVARLRELRDVSPKLHEITVLRGQGHQAEEWLGRLSSQRLQQVDELVQKESALKQTREKRMTLENQITRDETRLREIGARLQKSHVELVKLQECERQESDLEQLREDAKRLPADPAGDLARARETFERLEALARLVPQLSRVQSKRDALIRESAQVETIEKQQQEVRARGEERKREIDELTPLVEEAKRALEQANEQATEARTLRSQARQHLQELTQLGGAKVCRHCGQTLTPGHLEEEKRRRTAALQVAETKARETSTAQEEARKTAEELESRLTTAQTALQAARETYGMESGHLKQAKAAVERLQEECAVLYGEVPDDYRFRISPQLVEDWRKTVYPTAQDTDALKGQTRGLDTARRQKQEAEEVQRRWNQFKTREAAAEESLDRLRRGLPDDRQGIRKEHADLDAQQKALFKSVDAGREQKREVEREVERLSREREAAQSSISQTDARSKEQELVLQNAQRGISAVIKVLPAAWHVRAETIGLRELHTLKTELTDLEQRGTDDSAKELELARAGLEVMRQAVVQLEGQEATFAVEMRQDPGAIVLALNEAKLQDHRCDSTLSRAREQLALLENTLKMREQIVEESRALEKDLQSHRVLADLLGRERLQLFLVRQAERQVVEYANAVLDRLSGGQLYLKLSGEANGEGSSAKALELEAYNRATGERPINVAFLSGSQKFRVAVSLALGIGQYASRQHRPIESVIIDEGFGCLDSQGRQVMIQELQALRSQMRCILLVSHQEDFAESFTDGYHFHLEGGATRVERFQK
jgi:exonuclease SbcC